MEYPPPEESSLEGGVLGGADGNPPADESVLEEGSPSLSSMKAMAASRSMSVEW